MPPFPPIASQIPMNALMALGNEVQAHMVADAGAMGNTLLALEHAYGSVSFEDHLEAEVRLNQLGGKFKSYVADNSTASLSTDLNADWSVSTLVLNSFLEKQRVFAQDAVYPSFLADLLLGRKRHMRPANQTTSLFGLAAHLGGLANIPFLLLRNADSMSLFDPRGSILDFPSGKAAIQIAPATEPGEPVPGEPLIALVAFHLISVADGFSEVGHAAKMYHAARMIYPG
ncbi:MAG TPA: hypothetical protein VFX30_11295 [bacterium]|nr:hypothetical protein [bacterium]